MAQIVVLLLKKWHEVIVMEEALRVIVLHHLQRSGHQHEQRLLELL